LTHTLFYKQKKAFHQAVEGTMRKQTTKGCGTRPVSIGSRRRRAECIEHFGVISVFAHVRFAFGKGQRVLRQNVIRNCSKCWDSTWASNVNVHWFCLKAVPEQWKKKTFFFAWYSSNFENSHWTLECL